MTHTSPGAEGPGLGCVAGCLGSAPASRKPRSSARGCRAPLVGQQRRRGPGVWRATLCAGHYHPATCSIVTRGRGRRKRGARGCTCVCARAPAVGVSECPCVCVCSLHESLSLSGHPHESSRKSSSEDLCACACAHLGVCLHRGRWPSQPRSPGFQPHGALRGPLPSGLLLHLSSP